MSTHIMLIPFLNMHTGSPSLLKVRPKAITTTPGTSAASNGIENKIRWVLFYWNTKVKQRKELLRHPAHLWQGKRWSAFLVPIPTFPTPLFYSWISKYRPPVEMLLYNLVEHLNSQSKIFFFFNFHSSCPSLSFLLQPPSQIIISPFNFLLISLLIRS